MTTQQRRHPYAQRPGRYTGTGMFGLADATYNSTTYRQSKPTTIMANQVVSAVGMGRPRIGTYPLWNVETPVYDLGGILYAYGPVSAAVVDDPNAVLLTVNGVRSIVTQLTRIGIGAASGGSTGGSTGTVSTTDCPPQENCQERLVNKTVYVTARPVDGAIEIPVAYKKYICEGDSVQPPEIDCDELLQALKQAVASGDVPGMTMQGLGLMPPPIETDAGMQSSTNTNEPSYAPDWCKDCREVMVKATAYVTDKPIDGAVPFNVKMKVLVCETNPDPTIDCDQVVAALQAGFKAKKWSALNGLSSGRYRTRRGLSEAVTSSGAKKSAAAGIMPGENDFSFDGEAQRLAPSDDGSGFPWWAVAIAAVGGIYLITK